MDFYRLLLYTEDSIFVSSYSKEQEGDSLGNRRYFQYYCLPLCVTLSILS